MDILPKSGSRAPWRLKQNYLFDMRTIRRGKIADEGLRFAKNPVAVPV
jgi:monooxygenase